MTLKEYIGKLFQSKPSEIFIYVSSDPAAPKHSQAPELILPKGEVSTWKYLDFGQRLLRWTPHNAYEADVWDANYTEWRARLFQQLAAEEGMLEWLRHFPVNLSPLPDKFWNRRHELLCKNLAGDIWRLEAWLTRSMR